MELHVESKSNFGDIVKINKKQEIFSNHLSLKRFKGKN
jgi:hypothetical protein